MKRSRFLSFLLAVAAGVGAGLPITSLSDDTEVYVGSEELAQVQGVRPNVLIILDTSGSMTTLVPGTGKSRMTNMKEALQSILDGLNNVNVGLMRFSNPGGPILFPIAYIDENASTAFNTGGADVIVPITSSEDDAEEFLATHTVDLTSKQLELTYTPAFGGESTIRVAVRTGQDDAEEYLNTGETYNTGTVLDMGSGDGGPQADGIVFRNLTIPQDAYIANSYLSFTAYDNRSNDSNLYFRGWAKDVTNDNETFPVGNSAKGVSTQAVTTSQVSMLGMVPWSTGNRYDTDDLSAIVQEIVQRPGWSSGNDLGVIVKGDGLRRARSYNYGSGDAPSLSVTYATGTAGDQLVGLRFRNVAIPKGARIDDAVIQVTPARTLSGLVELDIYAEKVSDAEPFNNSTQKISQKLLTTTQGVTWTIDPTWVSRSSQGSTQNSPDLKAIVQELVDQGSWCGGNDIAFLIQNRSGSAWRSIHSFDGNPNYAPTLRVNYTYNPTTAPAGSGCVVQTVQRQVRAGSDDSEQTNDSGSILLDGNVLDMPLDGSSKQQTVGVRFQDVQVDPGAEVLDARLVFTGYDADFENASSIVFYGEATANAAAYAATRWNLAESVRPRTSASVTWNASSADSPLTSWHSNGTYTSPNLKSIVQEVTNGTGWKAGNALSFIIRPGTGRRGARSYESSPAQAPVLRITYKGNASATTGSSPTVRHLLKQTVNSLDAAGWTPIVDTLYESALYYRGEGVLYGKTRGSDGSEVERNTRVSHSASYTGGTVYRAAGCTDANLGASACASEEIQGSPTYISPIRELCGSNYIILLTDGEANNNHSVGLVKTMTGVSNCQTKLSDGSNVNEGSAPNPSEECGIDLGRYLYSKDQLAGLTGTQTVSTYTIGFNLNAADPAQAHAIQFLKDLAKASGGEFRPASTAAELAETFQAFFLDILNRSTSYAAPALSVNAFNKLYHREDVYLSLFQPSDRIRWVGNIKKYHLCQSTADGCELGSLLDKLGEPAIRAGRIDDGALDYWNKTTIPDGSKITKGGAGNAIPLAADRRVITFTRGAAPASDNLGDDVHELVDTNTLVTNSMLGLDAAASTEARSALIAWVRGVDVDEEEENESGDNRRYSFGDPLHSSPQAVTYGGTDEAPVGKLFVGTNDGAVRMINAETGEEEWIFYPPETLSLQARLRTNPNGRHVYGIDGTPTVWVRDNDGDGTIGDSSDDFVRVFVGMRRGGKHYYALDVTPASPLSDPLQVGAVYPKYMWRIDGGSADYPQLGQTWSRPLVTTIRAGTSTPGQSEAREVLIFAGGYDESQDTAFGTSPTGNAIYVANPLTGVREYWISGTAHSSGPGVQVPGMSYPIPSDLALMDSDGDGATDRIYVGDNGGQLWRIDLAPETSGSGGVRAVVGKLATVSSNASEGDKRKFFYPPDVVQVVDSKYSNVARYDLVTIASGDREHPLSEAVTDRLYAFRDLDYGPMRDANGNGLADSYPSATSGVALQGALDGSPAVAGDLFDASDVPQIQINEEDTTNLTALQQSDGWYLRFEQPGEKGLASPIVLAGKLFITTFTPQATELGDVCQLMEGGGRLYGLNVLTAEPEFNWDDVGEITSQADRVYQLAAGIPSGAVPIFQEEGVTLLIGVGGGAETVDPNIARPLAWTYWFQEQ